MSDTTSGGHAGAPAVPSPLVTGSLLRALGRLCVPMLVSGALQEVQGLIDLFWVGRLGYYAIAAVSLSAIVIFLLAPVAVGLMVGTVALVSRRVGERDPTAAGAAAAQSLLLAGAMGAMVSVAGWVLAPRLFPLLGLPHDAPGAAAVAPLILDAGVGFLRTLLAGQVLVFLLLACFASLQATGDTRALMVCSLAASVLNMVLDPALIYGLGPFPRLGVPGAALATVTSQGLALVLAVQALRRTRHGLALRRQSFRPDFPLCGRLLRVGLPGAGQLLLRSGASAALMRIVAICGPAAVAGYGVGMRWHMLILMPAFALGSATATLVGQNLGAGQPARARRVAWLAVWIDAGIMTLFAAIALLAATPLVRLFTSDPDVVRTGAEYLRVVSPAYPAVAFGIILGRALNGAGDSVWPMVATGISLWGLQLPAALLLSHLHPHATLGIWIAVATGNVVHALLILARFRGRAWMTRRV